MSQQTEQTGSVLVTGGGGFIGTWVLRELLARGLKPVAFDVQKSDERWQRILGDKASQVTFVSGSLLDRDALQRVCDKHQVSHIIQLAALLTPQCQQDPWSGCQINVLGSVALFELARANAGRIKGISYASSYAVYGPEADDSSLGLKAEDNRPPSFYGAFKLAVDQIAEQYWRHYGIASVGIRPHVVYGPERTQGLTAGPSLAARAAVTGESYTIGYTGRLGYDYVEDVAQAFVQTALNVRQGWNIVDLPSEPATPEEFVAAIVRTVPESADLLRVNGPAVPSNIPPKPRFISELLPDWQPTSLEDGVRKTVAFYR